jgi:aerobic carbon-monoxide dehydrogenase medium subunit
MKPPRFEYVAPATVEEALDLVREADGDARFLAGGQSLVPLLNMRFARPSRLVDLNRVAALRSVGWTDGDVRIGAMVRQHELEDDAALRQRIPLLADAAACIAHLAIRMRGTVGGSIAHADPAAELPATVIALGAQTVVRSAEGSTRTVPAADFFRGPFKTALAEGELLEAVKITAPPPGTGWAFLEIARVHGAFALAGAAALVERRGGGVVAGARLALCGVGATPYEPHWISEAMIGEQPTDAILNEISARIRHEVEPFGDGHAGPEYRRRVAGVLARRALSLAATRAHEVAE